MTGASTSQQTRAMFSAGGIQLLEPRHVEIEILVIEVADQLLLHEILEQADVQHVARPGSISPSTVTSSS